MGTRFFNPPSNICFEEIGDDSLVGQKNVPIWHDYQVDPETVGQWIGLVDKNGTKIFEGDFVKHYTCSFGVEGSETGKVRWDPDRCAFLQTPGCKLMTSSCECVYEVIGNEHDGGV